MPRLKRPQNVSSDYRAKPFSVSLTDFSGVRQAPKLEFLTPSIWSGTAHDESVFDQGKHLTGSAAANPSVPPAVSSPETGPSNPVEPPNSDKPRPGVPVIGIPWPPVQQSGAKPAQGPIERGYGVYDQNNQLEIEEKMTAGPSTDGPSRQQIENRKLIEEEYRKAGTLTIDPNGVIHSRSGDWSMTPDGEVHEKDASAPASPTETRAAGKPSAAPQSKH